MDEISSCPKCNSENTYEYLNMNICPECAHEWSKFEDVLAAERKAAKELEDIVQDAFGNTLKDGDNAVFIKDIKISGSSEVIKRGTKVTNIRTERNGVHNITARVDGFGNMDLKSELVKKS